jgi:hypothetical protein
MLKSKGLRSSEKVHHAEDLIKVRTFADTHTLVVRSPVEIAIEISTRPMLPATLEILFSFQ